MSNPHHYRTISDEGRLLVWLLSFLVECCFELWLSKGLFWAVFYKDLVATLTNIGVILITQWGIMNSCACWSMWGMRGLHLPQMSNVTPDLMYYTQQVAPWITFMAILFQLVFCGAVSWVYRDAVRVYIQRDDGMSNREWKKRKTMANE